MTTWKYTWKYVSVWPPEVAERFGLPAEAPVFASPFVRAPEACRDCGATVAPLVYAPGHITETLHRAPTCPGLWHYHVAPVRWDWGAVVVMVGETDCWVAARGRDPIDICTAGRRFRSEGALAVCWGCNYKVTQQLQATGTWRMAQPAEPEARGLAPLCEECERERAGYALTPWVLVLRDGRPSWRWAPSG
jgi:hypothetical protein